MSINKPGSSLVPQPSTTPAAPSTVGPETVTPSADAGLALRTHQSTPDADWRDLPDEVVGKLMNILKEEVLSPGLTPDERSTALSALLSLGSTSPREQQVLNHLLEQTQLDRQQLRGAVIEARRLQWTEVADHLEAQRNQLLDDFSATRELIIEAERTEAAITLPDDREGVELCFKEIGFSPAISTLMSTLNGKTVKLDASGIGRDRFISEILPALEKIPSECPVVLDSSSNDLTSDHLEGLVRLMAKKRNLYRLDLSGNPLSTGTSGPTQILKLFTEGGPLSHLYLSNTGFDTAAAVMLENSPFTATSLQQLDLRDNRLDDAGMIAVINALVPENDRSGLLCPDLHLLRLAGNDWHNINGATRAGSHAVPRQLALQRMFRPPTDIPHGDPQAPGGLIVGSVAGGRNLRIEYPYRTADDGDDQQRINVDEIRAEISGRIAEESRL